MFLIQFSGKMLKEEESEEGMRGNKILAVSVLILFSSLIFTLPADAAVHIAEDTRGRAELILDYCNEPFWLDAHTIYHRNEEKRKAIEGEKWGAESIPLSYRLLREDIEITKSRIENETSYNARYGAKRELLHYLSLMLEYTYLAEQEDERTVEVRKKVYISWDTFINIYNPTRGRKEPPKVAPIRFSAFSANSCPPNLEG
jgi:hypothetical protein